MSIEKDDLKLDGKVFIPEWGPEPRECPTCGYSDKEWAGEAACSDLWHYERRAPSTEEGRLVSVIERMEKEAAVRSTPPAMEGGCVSTLQFWATELRAALSPLSQKLETRLLNHDISNEDEYRAAIAETQELCPTCHEPGPRNPKVWARLCPDKWHYPAQEGRAELRRKTESSNQEGWDA